MFWAFFFLGDALTSATLTPPRLCGGMSHTNVTKQEERENTGSDITESLTPPNDAAAFQGGQPGSGGWEGDSGAKKMKLFWTAAAIT